MPKDVHRDFWGSMFRYESHLKSVVIKNKKFSPEGRRLIRPRSASATREKLKILRYLTLKGLFVLS